MSESRPSWTKRVLITVLGVLSLAATLFILLVFVGPFVIGLFSQELVSQDWSGYVAVTDLQNPQPLIVGVNASWIVPEVTPSQKNSYSAAWIGIGGYFDDTLIQVGTEQDSKNGAGAYSAWYELLPNDAVPISRIAVSPGDEMTASINLINSNSSTWEVEISDTTNGEKFQKSLPYESSSLSAEWIVERPTVGHITGTLANFGNITFTKSTANMSSTSRPINGLPHVQIVMYNRQNKPLVKVSPLSTDGSSFSVSYLDGITTTQSQLSMVTDFVLVCASDILELWPEEGLWTRSNPVA